MAKRPKEKIMQEIQEILPEREPSINNLVVDKQAELIEHKADVAMRIQACEQRAREKQAAKKRQATIDKRIAAGGTATRTPYRNQSILRQEAEDARNEALAMLDGDIQETPVTEMADVTAPKIVKREEMTFTRVAPTSTLVTSDQYPYGKGITRPEVIRLLDALNIILNVQLTKQDTANLLACLLTCNEAQLDSLYNNAKIPIVIKTVIKRLKDDLKHGNISTIESLWDRVFGKNAMALDAGLSKKEALDGILPDAPVSREAYIIIRDKLINN